jgi:hypothetical protein
MRRPCIVASLLLFALAACRSGKETRADCPVARTPVERFSLCLDDRWRHATDRFSAEGSFVVFLQPQGSTGSLMQIHVKKDPLQEAVTSPLDFAQQAVGITRAQAPNYAIVRTEPLTIDGKDTLLHIFDASPSKDQLIRYYQFVTTNGDIAYGFTAVMRPDADPDTQEQLLGILKSVSFR